MVFRRQLLSRSLSMNRSFSPTRKIPTPQRPGFSRCFQPPAAAQGVTDPYDPTQDIPAGVGLLAKLYAQYGNWNTALEAYSEGQGAVAASGYTPSTQTTDLLSYVNSYSVPSGLDTSGGSDLASLDLSSLGLPSFNLPDLTQSTIFPGVPDWVTWLGIAGVAAVIAARV